MFDEPGFDGGERVDWRAIVEDELPVGRIEHTHAARARRCLDGIAHLRRHHYHLGGDALLLLKRNGISAPVTQTHQVSAKSGVANFE